MPHYNSSEPIILSFEGPLAIVTLNLPAKKNALDATLYKRLASIFHSIDRRPDVFITILTGKGNFFSAGADVKAAATRDEGEDDLRTSALRRLSEGNLDLARALYRHTKILVAALNGPAIGLSAALLGHFDFCYAMDNFYLLTPFTTLSLVCEGGASMSFPRRMGIVKANEALLFGKKLGAAELHANGFINRLFPQSSDDVFFTSMLAYLREKIDGLDLEAALISKQLIKATLPDPDPSNVREVFAGADRFASGKPQEQFAKVAAKKLRHKI